MKKRAYNWKTIIAAALIAAFALSFIFAAATSLPRAFAYSENSDLCEELSLLQSVVSTDVKENFRFVSSDSVAFGRIYRFQQIHEGADVVGAQMTVSADDDGNVLSYDGKYVSIPSFGDKLISAEKAKDEIRDKYQDDIFLTQFVYYYDGQNVYPAYKLISSALTSEYYVSALDGSVLYKNTSPYVAMQNTDAFGNKIDVEVTEDGENYVLHDDERCLTVLDFDGDIFDDDLDFGNHLDKILTSSNGTDFDSMAVTVYDHVSKAYDFYTDPANIGVARYGINDKNNNGDPSDDYDIFILTNYGLNYENADFRVLFNTDTGEKVNFGYICVGNGVQPNEQSEGKLYQQGKAFDIIAHEYQHGVTAFTANFKYEGDSGALDEAFSDIFGSLVEGCDPTDLTSDFWTIGEEGVYDPHDKGLFLRSLIGGTMGQAYSVREKNICRAPGPHSTHNCDNNYVHENSTIISHVQYELSSLSPGFFTREKIGSLWYTTLLKLTSTSSFLDFANAFSNAARELKFPQDIQENVRQALINVGLLNDGQYSINFYGPEREFMFGFNVDRLYFIYNNFKDALEKDIVTDKFTYKFIEWQNKDGSKFDMRSFDNLTQDIDVYGAYDVFCYAIFVDENNSQLSKKEYRVDEKITPYVYDSLNLQKYTFFGWRTADMEENEYLDLSSYYIKQNTTFIPILRINSYTVHYFSDDSLILSQSENYGTLIHLPTNGSLPVKHNGLTLEGWYLDKDLTLKAENFTLTEDIDLYAKWIADDNYDQTKTAIIVGASLACVFIVFIPIIVFLTKRRKH